MSRLRLQVLTAVVFALAWTRSSALGPKQESGTLPIDPPTPYTHYFARQSPIGRVLSVHGLDVSKATNGLISRALADSGFEVYAIDLPGHGDSTARFNTALAEQAIHNAKAFLGDDVIVLGHSLGAGLLLDLAATEQFSTMVLLALPPISLTEIHAERVLIATGDLDIPRIHNFAAIAADIGDPKVEFWLLPWGGHSAPILSPTHIRQIVKWLGGDDGAVRTTGRMMWSMVMLVSAIAFGVTFLPGRHLETIDIPFATTLASYIVAYSAALFVLKFIHPLAWLRLFATDYLIGFLLISGVTLLAFTAYLPPYKGQVARSAGVIAYNPVFISILAAAYMIAVPGMLVASQAIHMSLSDGRWWRFPCIALAGLPLFMADELIIRRIYPRWKSEAAALITKALLLTFLLTGSLTFNREKAFLVLIVPLIFFFWVGLWSAAGVLHRYTKSAFSAALFVAIVQGWTFAAWFVMV